MNIALFIAGLLAGGVGGVAFLAARNATQEMAGLVFLLICAVLLVGAAIVGAVGRVERAIARPPRADPSEAIAQQQLEEIRRGSSR